MTRIIPPLGKNFISAMTLAISLTFFLLIFLLFSTCTTDKRPSLRPPSYEITHEEKSWLKEFFHDLLFEDPGAYVLYGTKPMSISVIEKAPSDEEKAKIKKWYDSLPSEEKSKYIVRKQDRYDFYTNFHKWQKIKDRFPIKLYLFGTFPSFLGDGTETLIFVNIEMMLKTLLKYYEDFRRVLGHDFDPFQVVFEIDNRDSQFWNRVLHNHALVGILLGFGQDNSWFFAWHLKNEHAQNQMGAFVRVLPSKIDASPYFQDPDPQHFSLPIFRRFGLHANSQVIEKYKQERKKIMAIYKGQDEVEVALSWLTR